VIVVSGDGNQQACCKHEEATVFQQSFVFVTYQLILSSNVNRDHQEHKSRHAKSRLHLTGRQTERQEEFFPDLLRKTKRRCPKTPLSFEQRRLGQTEGSFD
jgi:hypothetical protein